MNLNSETWLQFLQDHWVIVAVAIAAIFIVMKLVKTVLKWVLVIAIIIGIVAYAGYSIDDIQALGSEVTDAATKQAKDQAIKAMAGEAGEAEYVDNSDGSYSIKTPNLELTGVPNSGEVSVKFRGIPLGTWDMEGAVRDFVLQARAAAK